MKGPTEVNSILSGLKTRQVNMGTEKNSEKEKNNLNIEDLKDLKSTNLPKSKRKQKAIKIV